MPPDASSPDDRDLGLDRPIARRDFLNGVALGVGALAAHRPGDWLRYGVADAALAQGAARADTYPPARTGIRGSHDGAFEVAHRVRDRMAPPEWGRPVTLGEGYDLVVVGAGLSGLAAAHFFRQRFGATARILVLDNHDDFGGHARRNEFTVDGRTLVTYAGTQSIDTPSRYSTVSRRLLRELGVDLGAFETAYDQRFWEARGMGESAWFDRETFGRDVLVRHDGDEPVAAFLARTPLAPAVRRAIAQVYDDRRDRLPGRTAAQKWEVLSRTSYRDWLVRVCGLPPEALPYFQKQTHEFYGVGIDAVPAGDCVPFGFPGFAGLGLGAALGPRVGRTARLHTHDEPYIHHFPDGNHTLARLLVRGMIPGAVPGRDAVDVVGARVEYGALDRPTARVRLRLSSTVVEVRNQGGAVEVTYVRAGRAERVRAGRCVMACWHGIIPHLMPELPAAQAAALRYGVKVPLVYANVALRRWEAFERLRTHTVSCPGGTWHDVSLDFPVSYGAVRFARRSDEPVVVTLHRAPCVPGLPARDQHRAGRAELLGTPWATYERSIRDTLARVLGGGGFDPARDIAAITVNRWPHGYAYEYNSLWDPAWAPGTAPNEVARRPIGRVAFANADAAAYAYTDAAFDEAWRAVGELG